MHKSSVICTSKESSACCNGQGDFLEEAWPCLGLLGGEERELSVSSRDQDSSLVLCTLWALQVASNVRERRRDKMSRDGISVSSEAAERKCVKKAEQMGLLLQD